MRLWSIPSLVLTLLTFSAFSLSNDGVEDLDKAPSLDGKKDLLTIVGKVVYDKDRIEGCSVKVYQGNDLIHDMVTSKSGKYEAELEIGHQYMFHFQKEGYLNKMFAVDAENNIPKHHNGFPAYPVNVIMIPMERFTGVDMDHLEFPFALVRYSKRMQMFDNDPKYTQNMKRAISAAMLQSGRLAREED